MQLESLKNLIQSANLNFLIGSGLSAPFLSTLSRIELWLTEISADDSDCSRIIKSSIYREYFQKVILPNHSKESGNGTCTYETILSEYANFFNIWNAILNKRNSLVPKQVNCFTTNIDVFQERGAEKAQVEFCDGFSGSFTSVFSESNFNRIISTRSSRYDNLSQIPSFNIIKMHGGINWVVGEGREIMNDRTLEQVNRTNDALQKIAPDKFIPLDTTENEDIASNIKSFSENAQDIIDKLNLCNETVTDVFSNFSTEYFKIKTVNPTKAKFSTTVDDYHFYELLRLYSNALEKENSVLFVMGFSFADEHIANITQRVANSNPTLKIIVFAYKKEDFKVIENNLNINAFKNNNVEIWTYENIKSQLDDFIKDHPDALKGCSSFDFATINKFFKFVILNKIV